MFTGIVSAVGRVTSIVDTARDRRSTIKAPDMTAGLQLGASVAHAGCCLTVVDVTSEGWAVEVSNETLSKTTLGHWSEGSPVNLERAARLGDELGGHIVSGHIDAVGEVLDVSPDAGSHRVTIRAPAPLHRLIAPKGSITVDGVSLTVNGVDGETFAVNLIPHTWDHTTLNTLQRGSRVNLEADTLARYAVRWLETAQ